jgi:hypothetical protein
VEKIDKADGEKSIKFIENWGSKMMLKSDVYNCQNLGSKNDENRCQNDPSKIHQKTTQKINFQGGVRGGQNRQKSTSGDRDPKT